MNPAHIAVPATARAAAPLDLGWRGLTTRFQTFVRIVGEVFAEARRLQDEARRRYPHLGSGY